MMKIIYTSIFLLSLVLGDMPVKAQFYYLGVSQDSVMSAFSGLNGVVDSTEYHASKIIDDSPYKPIVVDIMLLSKYKVKFHLWFTRTEQLLGYNFQLEEKDSIIIHRAFLDVYCLLKDRWGDPTRIDEYKGRITAIDYIWEFEKERESPPCGVLTRRPAWFSFQTLFSCYQTQHGK